MTSRWRQIEELFAEVMEKPASAREAFIEEHSGGDDELAREVRSLLANAHESDDLRSTVDAAIASFSAASHRAGARLGPYRLIELVGEGGMGAVYRAKRDDKEVAYDVAIKILRHDLASPTAIARFRDERQILATLDHPAIVRMLDGGSTDDGVPFLVMEHISGVPITKYARTRSVRERIGLIIQVASGLSYAHGKLVVHRDIKPSNILVEERGMPKLLDFGIAKLLDATTREAAQTRTGMAMLTPEYASPEQARGEPVAVASDVYSLGAVFYELLAERPPHQLGGTALETLEAICERTPPRPSTLAPIELRREIAGDLDSIVLKALQKLPDQRYSSIAAFVDDLERYLDGRPVVAREATLTYRARKFVARNRGKLALGVAFVVALGGASAFSFAQARRADRQAARAEAEARRLVGERGWQEVANGHAGRALPYLVEALREQPRGVDPAALRFLIAEALRPYEAEIAFVPFPQGLLRMAWSPDGAMFALAGQGGVALYDREGAHLTTIIDDNTWNIAFSPDGQHIAFATQGRVRVADLHGRVVRDVPATMPARVAILPAGQLVVVEDRRVLIVGDSQQETALAEPTTAIAVSPDGARIAIGDQSGMITLWDPTLTKLAELRGHTQAVVALQLTHDGRLISASYDHTARIWSSTGAAVATLAGHSNIVEALALDHDEGRVATCSRDGTVKVWDATTGAFLVEVRGHENGARAASFSGDGHYLLTTGGDNAFRVWDLATGSLEAQYEARIGGGARPSAMAGTLDAQFAPAGDRFLGAAGNGATLLGLQRAPLLVELATGSAKQPRGAAFSPDEQRVAIVGLQQIEIWNTATSARITTLHVDGDDLVWDVSWAPDARSIAVAGRELAAIVPVEGGSARRLLGHTGTVNRIAYRPGGAELLTAGSDGTVRLWDPASARELARLDHPAPVSAAAWNGDGSRIVTACADSKLRIWDSASHKVITTIDVGERYLDVAFSPDGRAVAGAAHGGAIAVWTMDGKRKFIATGHSGPVTSITWSPDGALLASTADDQTARIWDAGSGKQLAVRRHRNGVMAGAWSRDGRRLLTASTDGSARIWDVHRDSHSIAELEALLARYLQFDHLDANRELRD